MQGPQAFPQFSKTTTWPLRSSIVSFGPKMWVPIELICGAAAICHL
jgi:hypothetical protein